MTKYLHIYLSISIYLNVWVFFQYFLLRFLLLWLKYYFLSKVVGKSKSQRKQQPLNMQMISKMTSSFSETTSLPMCTLGTTYPIEEGEKYAGAVRWRRRIIHLPSFAVISDGSSFLYEARSLADVHYGHLPPSTFQQLKRKSFFPLQFKVVINHPIHHFRDDNLFSGGYVTVRFHFLGSKKLQIPTRPLQLY